MTTLERQALYTGEHPPRTPRRGLLDDTLDAHPPYHLYSGTPSPEAIEAARKLMAERGVKPEGARKSSAGRAHNV
jgi:hypothetical protein